MMSMFQYLCEVKGYTENESEETVLRWENGFDIPPEVKENIDDYYDYRFFFINPNIKNGAR